MLYSGIFQLTPNTDLQKFSIPFYGKYKIIIKDIYIKFNLITRQDGNEHMPFNRYVNFSVYSPDFIKLINNLDATFIYPDTYHNLNLGYYTILNGYLNLQIKQNAGVGPYTFKDCIINFEFEKLSEELKI
jgi:hypothetical protein